MKMETFVVAAVVVGKMAGATDTAVVVELAVAEPAVVAAAAVAVGPAEAVFPTADVAAVGGAEFVVPTVVVDDVATAVVDAVAFGVDAAAFAAVASADAAFEGAVAVGGGGAWKSSLQEPGHHCWMSEPWTRGVREGDVRRGKQLAVVIAVEVQAVFGIAVVVVAAAVVILKEIEAVGAVVVAAAAAVAVVVEVLALLGRERQVRKISSPEALPLSRQGQTHWKQLF